MGLPSATSALAEVPLFSRLPPAALDRLAHATLLRRYRDGQVLCSEGDPGEALSRPLGAALAAAYG